MKPGAGGDTEGKVWRKEDEEAARRVHAMEGGREDGG